LSLSGVAGAVRPEVEQPSPVEVVSATEEPLVFQTPMPVPEEEAAAPVDDENLKVRALSIPRPEPQPEATLEPEETVLPDPYFIYTVQEGDTASALAEQFGISTDSIVWNNVEVNDRDLLIVGEQIRIPTRNGIIHEVSYGQTLSDIAGIYGVDVEDILASPINDITSPDVILEYQMVFVPDGVMPAPPEPVVEEPTAAPAEEPTYVDSVDGLTGEPAFVDAPPSSTGYIWPVSGPISSYFGPGHPLGIDIDLYNNPNAPIAAAAAGTVLIAGGDPCCSYGLQVLLQHEDGSQTRYAHFSSIQVSVGQYVEQGQILGNGGCTGYCTGNHLHFEIIRNGGVVDPLAYLP
jgi:murein DD-endopeptidase MepM/ murein hydrolase activator NlpD